MGRLWDTSGWRSAVSEATWHWAICSPGARCLPDLPRQHIQACSAALPAVPGPWGLAGRRSRGSWSPVGVGEVGVGGLLQSSRCCPPPRLRKGIWP